MRVVRGLFILSIMTVVASEKTGILKILNELDEKLQEMDNELEEEPSNDEDEEIIEGDIAVRKSESRNGILGSRYRWRNAVIPFEIRGKYKPSEMENIRKAMRAYHKETCIRFVPRKRSHSDYISINNYKKGICSSPVGKQGGKQVVSLGKGCLIRVHTPIHELMHSAGFTHEQNRSDRDDWIKVYLENVIPNRRSNFRKRSPSDFSDFGTKYNYDSVMHYGEYAFSIEPDVLKTMTPKRFHKGPIGEATYFADTDIIKLNRMYKCKGNVKRTVAIDEPEIKLKN